jgi:hypothetical protein
MFSLYLYFRSLRKSSPALIKATVIIKVYYWYEVPGYQQKTYTEQEKTLRKLQLLNASTKSSL